MTNSEEVVVQVVKVMELARDWETVSRLCTWACRGLEEYCWANDLAEEVLESVSEQVNGRALVEEMILVARSRIEREPGYSKVAARLLRLCLYEEVCAGSRSAGGQEASERRDLRRFLEEGVAGGLLQREMLKFDLARLEAALCPKRDDFLDYCGMQLLYDRYLLHISGRRIETPQHFWMRIAMGLALKESDRDGRAIEFYEVMSQLRYVPSTPTLFHAGTTHPQLSSCYIATISDDLDHIFKVLGDCARLSKWAGGIGLDWTNIRATGAPIKGTRSNSPGVIPFLKIASDTAVAVNQAGRRKGGICAYMEIWHLDIEGFLELRQNTGDDRRRAHDLHTACWIPDLFMKRLESGQDWTLFNPSDVPDLHRLYGQAFEARYVEYEKMTQDGRIDRFRQVSAPGLWRKLLSMVYETGHPWLTFKDAANIRSPQSHIGVVNCSNLCTEVLLNTSNEETAVCNLGSINLVAHLAQGAESVPAVTHSGIPWWAIATGKVKQQCWNRFRRNWALDWELLAGTIRTAVRMLDNVIDVGYCPTVEAQRFNARHRPIGLGMMGFQDCLHTFGIEYESEDAATFADNSTEFVAFHSILTSAELARERGPYETYRGSKWDQGLLPIDTISILERERGTRIQMDSAMMLDWSEVRDAVKRFGMRNCSCLAIAPTTTIAHICGVSPSIEPTYKNLYVRSNLSGEFTKINERMVRKLQQAKLWDDGVQEDLKFFDGSLQRIAKIPEELKRLFKTAFEIDSRWLIECASRRQKWIDMGQSLCLYLSVPDGRTLSGIYALAWQMGLKTTYYLRTLGATTWEKASVDINRHGVQPQWMKARSASADILIVRESTRSAYANRGDCDYCEACE